MKICFSLFLLFLSHQLACQVGYNQRTAGVKIGAWPEFYANGKLRKINYFGTPHTREVKDKATAFALGVSFEKDTILYFENLLYTDHYEYDENWILPRIKRDFKDGQRLYLFGNNGELGLESQTIDIEGRVAEEIKFVLPLINYSEKEVRLEIRSPLENIYPESKIFLPPKDTTAIVLIAKVESGARVYTCYLEMAGVSIELMIRSFGYHITSEDFNGLGSVLIKSDRAIYSRKGHEALLELYTADKATLLKTYSLALQKSELNLEEFEAGQYWLKIINYADEQIKWCELELEMEI